MAGCVLRCGSDIDHDHVAGCDAFREFGATHFVELIALAEVGSGATARRPSSIRPVSRHSTSYLPGTNACTSTGSAGSSIRAGLGLTLSTLFVKETRSHARHEAANHTSPNGAHHQLLSTSRIFTLTSFSDKALSSCSQAGLVNNLNDLLAWGLFPIYFANAGLSIERIGILAALYPPSGDSDSSTPAYSPTASAANHSSSPACSLKASPSLQSQAHIASPIWAAGAMILGAGTAMVYPTLLAAIGDVAHPAWRARSVGVYRLWRDGGFAIGALLAGILAGLISVPAAIYAVAALTAASGLLTGHRMYETHGPKGPLTEGARVTMSRRPDHLS